MTLVAADAQTEVTHRPAQFRYGVVFLLVLALVFFEIVSPDADWARAIDVTLAAAALTVVVATSRARGSVRLMRAFVVAAGAAVAVIGIAVGLFSAAVAFLVVTLLVVAIPATLIGGLARLIRDEGVTPQVVAGALTIYLLVGLLFASVIAVASHVGSAPYFAEGAKVTGGERVYYSFTVLTTTGFGDYTAATPFGHALAVLEMLSGQLYLVTVIGVVVGNFAGRRRREG
jgi:hypothetical protein